MFSSPAKDFALGTLARVQTFAGKLIYCSELWDEGGIRYQHWGMSQRYGDRDAQVAMAQAHREVVAIWLSLRSEEIEDDVKTFAAYYEVQVQDAVRRLQQEPGAFRRELSRAEREHYQVMMTTLEALLVA